MASGRHQIKLLKQLFAPTLGISPSPSPLPFLSPPSSVTVWQQQLSILEGGVAACQSAARVGLSPAHPAFSLSITSNHAISPATLPFASWQPSVCVHHTSCLSCLLPCIIYQIALCPSASQLLLINPRIAATFFLFFPSYFSLSPSIHLSFRLSPPHPPPPTQGFHYTSIGLWLLPSPRAPVSSLPPAAQSPRLCISTPTVPLFSPTAPFICLSLSRHLPPVSILSFLYSAPSVPSIYATCHPNPVTLFPFPAPFFRHLPPFSLLFF